MTWKPTPKLTVSAFAEYNWYIESFGSTSANLYNETFTFFSPYLKANYQFGQHWLASLRWDYNLKNSDVQKLGYAQNIASIQVLYQF